MRRLFAILDYALGALTRRPGKALALVSGLALVTAMLASLLFVHGSLAHEAAALAEAMPDLTVQRVRGGRPERLDASELDFLREHPGVRSATGRVWGYLYVPPLGANASVIAISPGEPSKKAPLLEGALPSRESEVAVGDAFARGLGLLVGDSIALPYPGGVRQLRVVGVFTAEASLQAADVILATEQDARVLLGYEGDTLSTDVVVTLARETEADAVTAEIGRHLPDARVVRRDQASRAYALTFGARSGALGAMLVPLLACFLLLAWDRLSGLGRDEREELGVLALVGWDTRDILLAGLFQNGLIAALGAVLGALAAYAYVYLFGAPLLLSAMLGWSRLHPTIELTPAHGAAEILTLLAFVVVPFTLASLAPAFRAADVDPDTLLRGQG